MMLEQSPAARSSKAPSDPPSELSSWRDDASSSLATCSADRPITVNTQRARMGDHLKGKLEGMIRQRFEDYLRIAQTLQNETGKLAALECELRTPPGMGASQARVSVSCSEDGTFYVYTVPDFSVLPRSPADSPFGSQAGEGGSCKEAGDAQPQPRAGFADGATSVDNGDELLGLWVKQVCEFGMSGRCHSLTALFHFGYTAWKQLLGDDARADSSWRTSGGASTPPPDHIAEEEELSQVGAGSAVGSSGVGVSAAAATPMEESPPPRSLAAFIQDAERAMHAERHQQAMDLCSEGLAIVRGRGRGWANSGWGPQRCMGGSASSSSPAAASSARSPQGSRGAGVSFAAGEGGPFDEDDYAVTAAWQLLSMRANALIQLLRYSQALQDAEELISLQPTCAEGYYLQSTALGGLGRSQEALESLMSALEFEPQNPIYQQAFNALFEDISAALVSMNSGNDSGDAARTSAAAASGSARAAAPAVAVLQARRPRGRPTGDALSQTTQATRLSSRSTTPTEVSALRSRSSSNDSISVAGVPFEEQGAQNISHKGFQDPTS